MSLGSLWLAIVRSVLSLPQHDVIIFPTSDTSCLHVISGAYRILG